PRTLAASMKSLRLARAAACPTKSSSVCGRSVLSSSTRLSASIRGLRSLMPSSSHEHIADTSYSPRQFLQPKPDELCRIGILARFFQRSRDGIRRLIARITEIGKRRHGIRDGGRGRTGSKLLLEPDGAARLTSESRGLVLQFGDDALRH